MFNFGKMFEKGPVNSPEEEAKLKEIRDAQARQAALAQEQKIAELEGQEKEKGENEEETPKTPETIH